jgi:hypothetical protein
MNRSFKAAVEAAAAKRRAQSKCKNGHLLTEENVYRPPKRPTRRHCKLCQKNRKKEWVADNPNSNRKYHRKFHRKKILTEDMLLVRRNKELERIKENATGELASLINQQEKDSRSYKVYSTSLNPLIDLELL